jgi:hypothetical protein
MRVPSAAADAPYAATELKPRRFPASSRAWLNCAIAARGLGGTPHGDGTPRTDQFFFALAASHSFWVSSLNPWPLQEFWPLQELVADLQADWPLQAFTP